MLKVAIFIAIIWGISAGRYSAEDWGWWIPLALSTIALLLVIYCSHEVA